MFDFTLESVTGKDIPLSIEDRMYIDGEFVGSEKTFDAVHPATEETMAAVPIATEAQVDEAVTAARRASNEWRKFSVKERRDRLLELADAVEDYTSELATLEVADNGSCHSKMAPDIDLGIERLRYYANLGTELKGDSIPMSDDAVDFTLREPYGVVAALPPSNHPAMFVLAKLSPALVAGNGMVLKPSDFTSLSALYIAHIVEEEDVLPSGLFNVITGKATSGSYLVSHPDVGLISLNGQSETGKAIMKSAADNLTETILELGGKNPAIVFPDVDVESTADGIVDGMNLTWQGQSCTSGSRLLIHEDVYDEIVPRVVEQFENVRHGDPFDETSQMGAMVSEPHYHRVQKYIETAKREGCELLTSDPAEVEFDTGYFIAPRVFEVEPHHTIAQEEIFGPVLSVIQWSEYEEMVEIANGVDYGLAASVWTDNVSTAIKTVQQIEAGHVSVNVHQPAGLGAPFGGMKESGMGRQECLEHLLDHTRQKNVYIPVSSE